MSGTEASISTIPAAVSHEIFYLYRHLKRSATKISELENSEHTTPEFTCTVVCDKKNMVRNTNA